MTNVRANEKIIDKSLFLGFAFPADTAGREGGHGMTTLQDTPRASRLHIGLFGRRNSGKSSLMNALTGQEIAIVSARPGTTTDPVYKSMEIAGIGPVVFIDTAGFDDDEAELGAARVHQTERAAKETDIALVLFPPEEGGDAEALRFAARLKEMGRPVLAVVSQADLLADGGAARAAAIGRAAQVTALAVSARERRGLDALRREIARLLPADYALRSITGDLCREGDTVLLVMPQDIQAPKGRLILPQVQTLRELLDKHALVLSCTTDKLDEALALLREPPRLIITDSQAFRTVHEKKPKESLLTSFSVLFAALKGDLSYFLAGARLLAARKGTGGSDHILIAEACTHKPLAEDIGRVKLPRLLRRTLGGEVAVNVVSGKDFPEDLTGYDLIIHCGSCMFNRSYVLCRVAEARAAGVPMTNYGLAIAALLGILPDVALPERVEP